jgi:TonB-dependent SusC/RagA subfamily outer membrane receptor
MIFFCKFKQPITIEIMKNIVVLLMFCLGFQSIYSQKRIAIYWDASYSMSDRQLDREFQFLNNYFTKNENIDVKLVMFSNVIILQGNYSVKEGNWSSLKKELERTIYDGATSYSNLFKEDFDEYLIFTDGIENLDELKPLTNKPIHIISSLPNSNTVNLKLLADLSSGSYVYLYNKPEYTNKEESFEQFESGIYDGYVSGIISGIEGELAGVSIINKNTGAGVSSGENGQFKIKAKEGDVLIFSYIGKKTVNFTLSKANIINVTMGNVSENLDEVIITNKVEKEEKIITGYGEVNRDPIGYSTQTITTDQLPQTATTVGDAVVGKFSGLKLAMNQDLSLFKGRGTSLLLSEYGLIVIDGMPLDRSNVGYGASTNFIDPNNIESITHLKGLAATNRYGSEGNNGVLLITTKNATRAKKNVIKKVKLGTTATYSGNAMLISGLADTPYISKLKLSKSVDEAFNTYLVQREIYGDKPEFYLDVYDYFKGWNNDLLSKRVLSNVYEIAFDNVKYLRALSYKQQASKNYKDAVVTLKRVQKLAPKQSQSYRDLALANNYAGNYKEALKLYDNIDKNRNVGNIILTGMNKTITSETKNLITQHGNKLSTLGINQKFLRPIKYKARVVFEWNDFDAEFDLNIINPQKRFFTWSHTNAENSQRILQEKELGYGLEEFYLTSSDVGKWTFNMKYYGNYSKVKTPIYVKITIYKNFGSPNETKDIQVVRLSKKDIEQTVATVIIN